MNQETQQVQENEPPVEDVAEEAHTPAPLPTLGELMIEARERWNLSAGDVARQLRLGLRQVEALEQNHFDVLPGNTFVRGFIRNYAKVVQVEPASFLEAYERSRPQIQPPEIIAQTEQIDFTKKPMPKWVWYSAGGALLALLLPLLMYFALHDDEPASAVAPPASAPKLGVAQPGQTTDIPLNLPPPQVVSTVEAPPPTQEATQADVLKPPAATQPSGAILKLKFEGSAWVEVRDKSGKKIFSQLSRAGSEEVVQGEPPLSLIVGDAVKVRITYNDRPVDLTPHVKKTVARLTLE